MCSTASLETQKEIARCSVKHCVTCCPPLLTDIQIALQVVPSGLLSPKTALALFQYAVIRRRDADAPLPEALAKFNSALRRGSIVNWSGHLQTTALRGHTAPVHNCTWSPDGKTLASASRDRKVRLWDVATRTCLGTLSGHTRAVSTCSWSPDGKTLATASRDHTVRLWDVDTRRCLATLSGHTDKVWTCAWSPDGKLLASASDDETVRIWDVVERKCVKALSSHKHNVKDCSWSPDGRLLASASDDWTVRLWHA